MKNLKISFRDEAVSALLVQPKSPAACFVFAHGAGAGMNHPFMTAVANGLHDHSIATLRFQFPYMESGVRRPDAPALAQATVRAAVSEANATFPNLPVIAGGKSFGGRMTSQAHAASPLEGVRGLAFFGFPLHPANKPGTDRADHLADISIPMLFVQGSRDALADLTLLRPVLERLGPLASLHVVEQADHSFGVPKRSGLNDADVLNEMLDAFSDWTRSL